MNKYEYHLEVFDTDEFGNNKFKKLDMKKLQDLGAQGWELVSSDALIDARAPGVAKTVRIALWFKRVTVA
jgi:hypothetical protein